MIIDQKILLSEVHYTAVRASGAGGQNVNKVNTKIQLSWALGTSALFNDEQKNRLREQLKSYLNTQDVIQLQDGHSRSQWQNKQAVAARFIALIQKALQPPRKRIPTQKSKSADVKRLESKRRQAERKVQRRKFDL